MALAVFALIFLAILLNAHFQRREQARDVALLTTLRNERTARQTLGEPSAIEWAPVTALFAPPADCKSVAVSRVLVFHRNNADRRSLLVYVDKNGEVVCTDTRQFFYIGH